VKTSKQTIAIAAALTSVLGFGCGGSDSSGPLSNVDALVILQRPSRNDMGDIFQYTSYIPGARLVKLSPPTADGTLTTICCDAVPGDAAKYAKIDIQGYDISFDAKEIVFAGKLSDSSTYSLFILNLDSGAVQQLPTDPARDYVSPIWMPGDYILYTSNAVVEKGAKQHRDEYERGVTIQLGRIKRDGSADELGPRNLSHRTLPSLASDGRVVFTQWDHLGPENSGHLMFVDQDLQNLREGFGKEGTGASNSVLKAQEIAAGRFVAIATARNRTVQAGALIDIRLGTVVNNDGIVSAGDKQAEARATYVRLTPDVPVGNEPSSDTVGRYYDAYPLNAKDKPDLLVSWADGPVESSVLSAAGLSANFGVYLYDSAHQQRRPILDDPAMWDIFARPLQARTAPPLLASATDPKLGGATEIGALNVYDSTIKQFDPGSIYGVRIAEGFSSEEGFPEMFGTPMFEGQAVLGVAPILSDGSWRAQVPGNVPLHIQAIDKFGMSLLSEPVWFSGRAGEARVCGGCHEDRTKTVVVIPGQIQAFSKPAIDMFALTPRVQRLSLDFSRDKLMGVAWDKAVQPIFDAKCVSCHGDSNTAGIAPYTITDPVTGQKVTITFNLCGAQANASCAGGTNAIKIGAVDLGDWPKSYISMAGPDMEAIEKGNLVVSGNFKIYMNPQDARGSIAIKLLNPPLQFPTQNLATRAFITQPHAAAKGFTELTADEFYRLIVAADLGMNFYARENNPGLNIY
jgi:hydrazine synthase alpha subunit-like protein